jgi:hypothetical protein
VRGKNDLDGLSLKDSGRTQFGREAMCSILNRLSFRSQRGIQTKWPWAISRAERSGTQRDTWGLGERACLERKGRCLGLGFSRRRA